MRRHLTIITAALAAAVLAASAADAAPTPTVFAKGRQAVKPASFCPSNRTCMTRVRWSIWNQRRAVGRGKAKTCAPGGTNCTRATVTVRLKRPRARCQRAYTRVRFRFPGAPVTRGKLVAGGCWYVPA